MVKILLFAKLKDITKEHTLHIDNYTVHDCILSLCKIYPELKSEINKCIFVLNKTQLHDIHTTTTSSDELAIIPPVSGG